MFETSATRIGKEFHELLGRVANGEFMTGTQAAKLFRGYEPDADDKAAADAIEAELAKFRLEGDRALDH